MTSAMQVADRLVDEAGPYEFVLSDFYSLMERNGVPREKAMVEFKRLLKESRIEKAGEIGLAFTYKIRRSVP